MVAFEYTNESLKAIKAGINPSKGDSILMVCGSGDQCFSVAESDLSLTAIDIQEQQINFAKQRQEYLIGKDYNSFLGIPRLIPKKEFNPSDEREYFIFSRNQFFDKKGLEKLAQITLSNPISFQEADLLNPESSLGVYNKMYISNIISYTLGMRVYHTDLTEILARLSSHLTEGGLIYLSDSERISCIKNNRILNKAGFRIHNQLTKRANSLQNLENSQKQAYLSTHIKPKLNWQPLVIQKHP